MDANEHRLRSVPNDADRVRLARDRIAALLGRGNELHLGMAVFDLWAAFDELVDPMCPPPPLRATWLDEPIQALQEMHDDLFAAMMAAGTSQEALSLGRAARCVARAITSLEQKP